MLASIAICTLNRAPSLARTLESLVAMYPINEVEWEVVVVNNGCTDGTDEVIDSFATRLPIRRLLEPHGGLSRARNRAVDLITSSYIIWTDDDVVVDRRWLMSYVAAFRRWPDAAIFGGMIVASYETPVVPWVRECEHMLHLPYSIRDLGDAPIRLSATTANYCFGANFAVRTAEQRRCRYDPTFGLAPNQHRVGEETKVIRSILADGGTGYWIPDARVEHCISRARQTARYIARCFAAQGETNMLIVQPRNVARSFLGAPRWLWRQVAEKWLRYRVHRCLSRPAVWMAHLQQYGYLRGEIRYWRQTSSARKINVC
jgi:glycosyltransferase involved in cell wall biosynthesis